MSGPCLSSSVADRPLRPATRRRLGELLPHQQADRPRAHPPATARKPPLPRREPLGINPRFHGLFLTEGQVVSRVTNPSATIELISKLFNSTVRLACLIHAASVRSEPESNSP